MNVRTHLRALAFILAGAILSVIVGLGAVVFMASGDCGSDFSYYGYKTPIADIRKDVAPVARSHDEGRRLGLLPAGLGVSKP